MTDREDSSTVPDRSPAEATIALASDHGGVELKALLVDHLRAGGHAVLDLGTQGPDSVDYPDIADTLAQALRAGRA
ncbi:ribose-5-phosphate isomerase, partial [Rhodospirillum rubrum]|uniref:RpiB/LacA/LacB family sugar-phosphate isomerase n=1 Tax=Rhodospirillum rubrum TaxID=1085 RepID=UPI00190903CE